MLQVCHPPHRLDFTLGHWLATAGSLRHRDDEAARTALESAWAPRGDGLAFLSVRSAFDCALTALAWPAGSEVLVSAVNIREMVNLVRLHGLVPVPLPINPRTMQPPPEAIDQAMTPRTRGVLLAHLFGARPDAAAFFARARSRGLFCFEDSARLSRPGRSRRPLADVSLFSFGTIKTATALGGALARVSSPDLRARMAAIQTAWPLPIAPRLRLAPRPSPSSSSRCRHHSSTPCSRRSVRLLGSDGCAVVRRLTRSFRGLEAEAYQRAVRHRPCAPLLARDAPAARHLRPPNRQAHPGAAHLGRRGGGRGRRPRRRPRVAHALVDSGPGRRRRRRSTPPCARSASTARARRTWCASARRPS